MENDNKSFWQRVAKLYRPIMGETKNERKRKWTDMRKLETLIRILEMKQHFMMG